jgi:hypothetical protein
LQIKETTKLCCTTTGFEEERDSREGLTQRR